MPYTENSMPQPSFFSDNFKSQQGSAKRWDPVLQFQKGHTEQTNQRSGNFFPESINHINSASCQQWKAPSNIIFLSRRRFRFKSLSCERSPPDHHDRESYSWVREICPQFIRAHSHRIRRISAYERA
jgi:hypothetical protein